MPICRDMSSNVLQRQIDGLRERNVNDAAAVVLDNASGAVLAYVGNLGRAASANRVDGVAARRQAGLDAEAVCFMRWPSSKGC